MVYVSLFEKHNPQFGLSLKETNLGLSPGGPYNPGLLCVCLPETQISAWSVSAFLRHKSRFEVRQCVVQCSHKSQSGQGLLRFKTAAFTSPCTSLSPSEQTLPPRGLHVRDRRSLTSDARQSWTPVWLKNGVVSMDPWHDACCGTGPASLLALLKGPPAHTESMGRHYH